MEAYLASLVKTKKPNTVVSYRRDLVSLATFVRPKEISSLTEGDLREYFSFLAHHASSVSLSRAVSVIRSYYRFSKGKENSPMENIRAGEFFPKETGLLTEEELFLLAQTPSDGIRGKRDEAMICLLCETGIRVSELVGMNREDLLSEECAVLCGTGEKRRKLFLSPATMARLEGYRVLSVLSNPKETALFLGAVGKRLTRQGFWKNLKDRALKLGIASCSPDRLRQSLAKHLIQRGKTRAQVKTLLGTQSESRLRKYEKQKKEERRWDC